MDVLSGVGRRSGRRLPRPGPLPLLFCSPSDQPIPRVLFILYPHEVFRPRAVDQERNPISHFTFIRNGARPRIRCPKTAQRGHRLSFDSTSAVHGASNPTLFSPSGAALILAFSKLLLIGVVISRDRIRKLAVNGFQCTIIHLNRPFWWMCTDNRTIQPKCGDQDLRR